MSVNCIKCITNKRTSLTDMMCDRCRDETDKNYRIVMAFLKLLKSHGEFTKREYKRDSSYNNESIGYKEEEEAVNFIIEHTGKNIAELMELVT